MFDSVDRVIDALGGTNGVAEALGLNPSTVSSWRARGSIPADRWLDLAGLADGKCLGGLTVQTLAVLHSKPAPKPAEVRT